MTSGQQEMETRGGYVPRRYELPEPPIRTGRPESKPNVATHIRGVRQGNKPGSYAKSPGHLPDGRSTAERSTGINPESSNPILPEMPNLSPA